MADELPDVPIDLEVELEGELGLLKMYLDAQFEKQALLISSLGERTDDSPLSGKVATCLQIRRKFL